MRKQYSFFHVPSPYAKVILEKSPVHLSLFPGHCLKPYHRFLVRVHLPPAIRPRSACTDPSFLALVRSMAFSCIFFTGADIPVRFFSLFSVRFFGKGEIIPITFFQEGQSKFVPERPSSARKSVFSNPLAWAHILSNRCWENHNRKNVDFGKFIVDKWEVSRYNNCCGFREGDKMRVCWNW